MGLDQEDSDNDKTADANKGIIMQRLERKMPRRTLLVTVNVVFAFLAVIGQVTQNVSLPLWVNSAQTNCSIVNGTAVVSGEAMGPYFVLTFASLSFVVLFGTFTLVSLPFGAVTKEDLAFPQWLLFLVGFFDSLNGVLVVFASPPVRTAPFLQAVLSNFLVPLTIIFRFFLLRKAPTLIKFICAAVVVIGLVFSLIPTIAGWSGGTSDDWAHQSIAPRILWPLCFMFGFTPAAIMNVIEEKSLKHRKKINLTYFLFCTSCYQLLTALFLFWVDIIPGFGFDKGIHEFGKSYWFALKCFFGGAGCSYQPGLRGLVFIFGYLISYYGSGLLIRYAEGATFLAVVNTLVTPLGALFWSMFAVNGCGHFNWQPHADRLTYFSIAGIVIMVPAIFIYNLGPKETKFSFPCLKKWKQRQVQYSDEEQEPLLYKTK